MVNAHATAIEAAIRGCTVVATYSLNTAQLSPRTGYVEGEVAFVDGLWGQALIICFLSGSMEALRFEHQDQSSWQARKLGAGETGGQGAEERSAGAKSCRGAGGGGDGGRKDKRGTRSTPMRSAECGLRNELRS